LSKVFSLACKNAFLHHSVPFFRAVALLCLSKNASIGTKMLFFRLQQKTLDNFIKAYRLSIYAMASPSLGFTNCQGTIIADRKLEAHIVECEVETTLGLKLHFTRYNPAKKDAVTGSATFSSFLNSLLYYKKGIAHRGVVFC
jgi:hypothetical protein